MKALLRVASHVLTIWIALAAEGAAALPVTATHATSGAAGAQPAEPALPYVDAATLPQMVSTGNYLGTQCMSPSQARTNATPWHQLMLRPEAAWPVSRGSGVTVAIVDTGVSAARVTALAGRVDEGLATVPGPNAGADCVGHGTFLAGLVAATIQTGSFVTGVAPEARVLPIRATTNAGYTTAVALVDAIRLATDRKARIILVGPGVYTPDAGLQAAVRYAIAHGSLVIAPATLDGQTQSAVPYPAGFDETLSVAGVDPTGAPATNEITGAPVELVAPSLVVSVGPGGDGNFIGRGPSFAAALVAGVAALVLRYHPTLGVAELVQRLESTAYHPAMTIPDPRMGYGTVDPAAAVAAIQVNGQSVEAASRSALQMPPAETHAGREVAMSVAAVSVLVMILVGLALMILPHGRRRAGPPVGG